MATWQELSQQMIGEATRVLGATWADVRAYAEPELKKIALSVVEIGAARQKGEISEEEARILLDMQKNASRAVLMANKVIGAVAAERVVNGALTAAAATLKTILSS